MRFNTIINRYILKEMFPPFGLNLIFFSFIFLMTQIIEIMNMVVNHRVGLSVIGKIILYTLPFFLEFIIPMSIMMSVLLTFLRMSSDNEILALKNGGLSVYDLLPPVMLFCLMGALLTEFIALYGLPWGQNVLEKTDRTGRKVVIKDINAAIEGASSYARCVGVSNCSLPEQKIYPDTREFNDRIPGYWTLNIAKQSMNSKQ
jgi:lipopolysaccharide export system permease protein